MSLPEPRNRGVPLVGAADAVRTRWEVVARVGDSSPGDGLHVPPAHLSYKRHSDGIGRSQTGGEVAH
jgi:hypothetical protein